jgi:hypothetical protein
MSTYRFGRWETWNGTRYYNIEKKTLFGWIEEKYWVIYRHYGLESIRTDEEAKEEMMGTVDRLVKAGHTVL